MTSRSRLLLVNVMERDEGVGGGQKHEFWRDVIIECSHGVKLNMLDNCVCYIKNV